MENSNKTNNNFLLNSHLVRQVSVSEANNSHKSGNGSSSNLTTSKNNGGNSLSGKNIFSTLGKSHSSSIINSTTSAINKNLSSFLSGSNSHSSTSLQTIPQVSSNTHNASHLHLNSLDVNAGSSSKNSGVNVLTRNRSNTGGPALSVAPVSVLSTSSTLKKKPTSVSKQPLNVSSIFKRTEVIGRGKFGVVYKGYHIKTKHIYAIKVLNLDSNEDEIEDVQKEIKFLSTSKNISNVTKYYGSYLNETKLWIIMEYCAGGSLRTLLRAGVLDDKTISVIFRELLLALSAIHYDKVIHRDIKAANVLIGHDGKVKLCDFGIAAKLTQTRPRRQSLAGTPFWMSPEVITESASYDSKADIWSLGITVYESATGNPPYCEVDAMRAMQLIVKNKPPRLEGKQYSQSLKEFVALCLDENPYERPTAETLLKSTFITQYSSVKVSFLKELIVRYHNYKIKNKNNMSALDNEPSSLNKEEQSNVKTKTSKTSLANNKSLNDAKNSNNNSEQIISSSNAVNIPSTPMPLAPSMGERTFSDAFGAAVVKHKTKPQENANKTTRQALTDVEKETQSSYNNDNLVAKEKEEKDESETKEEIEEVEENEIEWDFDSIDISENSNENNKKSLIQNISKTNYKSDLSDDNYWDQEKNQNNYILDDDKQNTTSNPMNMTMGRQFSFFNTQTAAPASMLNSYHPHQGNTINKSCKFLQNTIHTSNLKYQQTHNNINTNKFASNQNGNNHNLQGTIQTGHQMSLKMEGANNRFTNTRVMSSNSRLEQSEPIHSYKPMNNVPEAPRNLMKLFEDLDTRHPGELELPLMTPTPMGDQHGNEPKSYFENISNTSRNENYAMYMMKNKKYMKDGKSVSNLSLNTDAPGTPWSETNVIEIPDELPIVTTPSMASIPNQAKPRSRSSTLNAVLTKNANAIANNLEIHRRGTISTGYLKTPVIIANQNKSATDDAIFTESSSKESPAFNALHSQNGSRLSPVKLDLKVNTSNNSITHNPKDFLEDGMGKRSPLSGNQGRASSPNQRSAFSSEPLTAMTPSSLFIPSPKRNRNLSMVGGQPKSLLGDTKNNADIMNSLLQPFNDILRDEESDEVIKPSSSTGGINNKRLIRDFKRNNPNLKLEMPIPENNISSSDQTIGTPSQVTDNVGQGDEVPEQAPTTASINQFGFNTNTTNNITIAMTPLAEKTMLFNSADIKKSEEKNLGGILEETDNVENVNNLNTPALTPGLITNNEFNFSKGVNNNNSAVALEKKLSEANYFNNSSSTNLSSISKLESGIKNIKNVNADDLKNNEGQSTTNLSGIPNTITERKLSNVATGCHTNINISSNNASGLTNTSLLGNKFNDTKASVDRQENSEARVITTSPLAATSNTSSQNASNSEPTEKAANNNGNQADNNEQSTSSNQVLGTNIINPRISSRVRTISNANSSSTATTPKIDDFADMRIMLLDYPALKENETGITKNALNENIDTSSFEKELATDRQTFTGNKSENNSTLDENDEVNITDLKEFLEEERDHYYYYALEQEQRDMLMNDLKTLIMDYETSFALLEHEFKVFDESLE